MKFRAFLPRLFLITAMFMLPGVAQQAWAIQESELLDPDVAFAVQAEMQGQEAVVRWNIADGYYLYRDRIQFKSMTDGVSVDTAELPDGKVKSDPTFGEVAIFRGMVEARVPVSGNAGAFELQIVHQGCADIGVCYPPNRQTVTLELPQVAQATAEPAKAKSVSNPLKALGALVADGDLDEEEPEFLDPEDAFRPVAIVVDGGTVQVRWEIADTYYLYRDKLKFKLLTPEGVSLGQAELPKAKIKDDPSFGPTAVYFKEVTAKLPVKRPAGEAMEVSLEYGYQGCAEAGLCYPPQKQTVTLILPAFDAAQLAAVEGKTVETDKPVIEKSGDVAEAATVATDAPVTEQDRVTAALAGGSIWSTIGWMFLAGLGLAFTACVYPMIPILSSLIVGQGGTVTPMKGFVLSLVYVEAVALTYAVLGVASGFAGAGIQAFFQNPIVLVFFALMFVGLALSMFGFFNIQLPAGIQGRLSELSNKQSGGNLIGVFIMGILSALIVGPCAGPVMAGAALYVAQTQDWVLGGLAFFALGNGMGAPLLLVGASGGKLLPKAGTWMDTVKAVFGVVLLAVAILMLERVLPGPVALALYATLFVVSGIYMGAFENVPEGVSKWHKLWKGLGLVLVVWGIITLIGAATGGRDATNPLHRVMQSHSAGGQTVSGHVEFSRIKSVADLDKEIAAAKAKGQPVMLDFYADWCTYCVTLEDYVFPDPAVRAALDGVRLIQADVTANDELDRALMNHLGLIAPPSIIFFNKQGEEVPGTRVIGGMDAAQFAAHAKQALSR